VAWRDFVAAQQGNGLIAMIETPDGVAAADAICETPGVKAVLLGPFDLSVAMGHEGEVRASAVQAALERVVAAARAAGMPLWMPVFCSDVPQFRAQLARWRAHGVRHFAIGADKIFLAQALAAAMRNVRGTVDG
jgi:4-hydroxy-2-oxoheptanedioate aldolase